ncbi:MAG TPA: DUF1697 domain-containing protein [Pseudonocardia sp.]
MTTSHILLLRGINVGAHNRIAMAALREMLTGLGFGAVRTLLNSGNAVLTADTDDPGEVAWAVERAIDHTFGLSIRTVVRSRAQIERVIARNPMPEQAEEAPKLFHVGFRDRPLAPDALTVINQEELAPERAVLDGDTLYLWFAGGVQNSALAKALHRHRLDQDVTMRNWNTVGKLLELAAP